MNGISSTKEFYKKIWDVVYLKKQSITLRKNNFHQFLIPVFACQLAQDSDSHKKTNR